MVTSEVTEVIRQKWLLGLVIMTDVPFAFVCVE